MWIGIGREDDRVSHRGSGRGQTAHYCGGSLVTLVLQTTHPDSYIARQASSLKVAHVVDFSRALFLKRPRPSPSDDKFSPQFTASCRKHTAFDLQPKRRLCWTFHMFGKRTELCSPRCHWAGRGDGLFKGTYPKNQASDAMPSNPYRGYCCAWRKQSGVASSLSVFWKSSLSSSIPKESWSVLNWILPL